LIVTLLSVSSAAAQANVNYENNTLTASTYPATISRMDAYVGIGVIFLIFFVMIFCSYRNGGKIQKSEMRQSMAAPLIMTFAILVMFSLMSGAYQSIVITGAVAIVSSAVTFYFIEQKK